MKRSGNWDTVDSIFDEIENRIIQKCGKVPNRFMYM